MSVQYKYTPFCPYCRRQNYYTIDRSEEVTRPEFVKDKRICRHCQNEFSGVAAIYPGNEVDLPYQYILLRIEHKNRTKDEKDSNELMAYLDGAKNLSGMMMHGVCDVTPVKGMPFTWQWDEDDSCYVLRFEYNDCQHEIHSPMWNDTYLKFLHEYVDLSRRAVDEYIESLK